MEKQIYMFEDGTKTVKLNIRIDEIRLTKIKEWCKDRGTNHSVYVRMVIDRTLYNCLTFPGYKQNLLEEVKAAVEDVQPFLIPVSVLRQNPLNGNGRKLW